MKKIAAIAFCALVIAGGAFAEQTDVKGCKDHPLFTRMPGGYWIHNCTEKQFDVKTFTIAEGKKENIEGHTWVVSFYPQATMNPRPSEVQLIRNMENAITRIGGKVLWSTKNRATFFLNKDGKDIYVDATAEFTGKYGYTIVEKGEMKQDIVANADMFKNDLKNSGHAAVYGILFDTAKADIKPESAQAIAEIAKLLKSEPSLNIYVVGHTDNVGTLDGNMKLSQARAEAVVQSLVKTHGIAVARLKSFGNGPYAPVAANDSDSGRAKNRRVELVKQ